MTQPFPAGRSSDLSVKERLWQRAAFAGLAFALGFALLAYGVFADSFQSLERYTYDLGVRSRDRAPSDRIAIIAIDDDSLRNLGRWPWPSALQAPLLDTLREGGPRRLANTALHLEPEANVSDTATQPLPP